MQNDPNISNESDDLSSSESLENAGLTEGENTELDSESEDSTEDASETVASKNEPNIIFVGDGEPTKKINDGMNTYHLPKIDVQADVEIIPLEVEGGTIDATVYNGKPFYHKNAAQIVQLFPDRYKHFVKKGS